MRIGDITKKRSKGQYRLFGTEYNLRETIAGLSFLTPCFLLSVVFVFIPIAISLSYAFTDANMLRLDSVNFIGFDNFVRLFQDASIGKALANTLIFVGCVIPLQFGTALGLALILNHIKRFNTFLRWAFFCPVMLSLAVTSMLWMNLLNPQDGLINALILALGGNPMMFLEDPDQAMGCIIFISAWQGAGYQMLILLSGLKNIPKELYEAAEIDRASKWQQFLNVTLPGLKPTMVFVLITMIIGAFRICVQPMIMTDGGPLDSTLTMSLYIYKQGVEYRDVGYSSAIAMVYTVIIAAVSLTLRKVLGGDNEA